MYPTRSSSRSASSASASSSRSTTTRRRSTLVFQHKAALTLSPNQFHACVFSALSYLYGGSCIALPTPCSHYNQRQLIIIIYISILPSFAHTVCIIRLFIQALCLFIMHSLQFALAYFGKISQLHSYKQTQSFALLCQQYISSFMDSQGIHNKLRAHNNIIPKPRAINSCAFFKGHKKINEIHISNRFVGLNRWSLHGKEASQAPEEIFPQEDVLLHQAQEGNLLETQVLRYLQVCPLQGLHQDLQVWQMQVRQEALQEA
eukprot:TRINITY_DN869_c0_g3_i12.p3 TRINITY_DN869_c0_g3~~TRINITY_DN869_c0_g3_i12.p3  ORF type:complete len:260 (+),score=-27.84 TRINITY_DN869_c0_g3_i12:462-1241(+)